MAAAQQSSQKSVCVTILLTFIIVLQVQEWGLNLDFGIVLTLELHSDFYEIPMMIIITCYLSSALDGCSQLSQKHCKLIG